jgi:hypothetical protein
MGLLESIGYILIGCVAIVSVFLVILALMEKKLKIRVFHGKKARNQFYIEEIAKVNINTPEESLKLLSKQAKSFFREAFHLGGSPDYSWLQNYFAKKNNKKAVEFCIEMIKYFYSGQKITKENLQSLISLLAEIIGSNRIITKEEQKELDKQSQKNIPLSQRFSIIKMIKK